MNRHRICLITIVAGQLFFGGIALAVGPQWQGNTSPRKGVAPVTTDKNTPQQFNLQCPSAYVGLKGELLPTYWEPADDGKQVQLIKSQVQGQSLYCVYRMPFVDNIVHSSILRLVPPGYNCASDGAGRFECRKK